MATPTSSFAKTFALNELRKMTPAIKYGNFGYHYHLNAVDSMLLDWNIWFSLYKHYNMNQIRVVGYLHDTVEDTNCTIETIYKEFGVEVGDAVLALTQQDGETYQAYLDRISRNELAVIVKLADSTSNLQHSLFEGNIERINKYTSVLQFLTPFRKDV